jgi:hypothetical protein
MVLFASRIAPFMPRRPVPLSLAEDARRNYRKASQESNRRAFRSLPREQFQAGNAGAASLPRLREACPCLKSGLAATQSP